MTTKVRLGIAPKNIQIDRRVVFLLLYRPNYYTMAKSTRTPSKKSIDSKSGGGLSRAYLLLYNLASCAAWAHVLQYTFYHLRTYGFGGMSTLYAAIGDELRWVQTFAVLEILHSALGLVRSPLGTTLTQVASRLLLVWGICYTFNVPEVHTHWAFTTMTIAWSITEVVRYMFYALGLFDISPSLLLWCR
jgi:very-long-chain (3R)-3-hydroxyacyl-CoA dehydratase